MENESYNLYHTNCDVFGELFFFMAGVNYRRHDGFVNVTHFVVDSEGMNV